MIEYYGYIPETHQIQTDDGYLLTLHRINYSPNCTEEEKKGPLLIQHGLFSSSADWVLLGSDHGLGKFLELSSHPF